MSSRKKVFILSRRRHNWSLLRICSNQYQVELEHTPRWLKHSIIPSHIIQQTLKEWLLCARHCANYSVKTLVHSFSINLLSLLRAMVDIRRVTLYKWSITQIYMISSLVGRWIQQKIILVYCHLTIMTIKVVIYWVPFMC